MGIKGDKLKRDSTLAAELLYGKLRVIEGISTKKMFGGHGVFHDGKMFGMVNSKGDYYFKVDDSNRNDYKEKGAIQHSRMPYFSVPPEIFDHHDDLIRWAKKAIDASTKK